MFWLVASSATMGWMTLNPVVFVFLKALKRSRVSP
ncbi:hypothetical protein H4684_004092 [Desulfomicrobium macestii]|uniref:Uncharacterized protein n=1 Tax=Desulfomicrobium macestii TaxID=90731 RepID=A0ABR9H9M7_9BACT|nr:hypothetical protein [Desulfomicrobium macestii]